MYKLKRKKAQVLKIISARPGVEILAVKIPGEQSARAINYPELSGKVKAGDQVLLNTTALDLGLGTGGYHFVIAKSKKSEVYLELDQEATDDFQGHIMKLRYTPYQLKVLAVEEKASPFHRLIKNFKDLAGLPVVILPLHSLLAPLAIAFKKCYPDKKMVYLMTEGGSLSLELSNCVDFLCSSGFIDCTITVGHAFGGDLEAVNIFSALAAAKVAAEADLAVVGMGPGLAGTGTPLGFSGMENVFNDYAVKALKGHSIVVPRIGFKDSRSRHYILSHHTITLLKNILENSDVVLPGKKIIYDKIEKEGLAGKHNYCFYRTDEMLNILEESNYDFCSMGRHLADDPLFFLTAAIAVLRYQQLIEE